MKELLLRAKNGDKDAKGQQTADAGIDDTTFHSFRHGGLQLKIGTYAENTEQHKCGAAD